MKRILALVAPAALAACDGTGTLTLSLAHVPPAAASAPASLHDASVVAAVRVTVLEAAAHVRDEAPDEIDLSDPAQQPRDDDGAWQPLDLGGPSLSVDLLATEGVPPMLGKGAVPTGRVTQIRVKLAVSGPAASQPGYDVIAGAEGGVLLRDGGRCDLVVPHSAADPGVKIVQRFRTIPVDAGRTVAAAIELAVDDVPPVATAAGCAYTVAPVVVVTGVDVT